jgi:hypothetical protein
MALCERDKVSWEAAPAAQFHRGSSSDQTDRGACRVEGFVLREDVPDGLGQLASEVDPGDLGAALAPQALLGPLVSLQVASIAGGVGRGFDQRPAQILGAVLRQRATPVLRSRLADQRAQARVPGQLLGHSRSGRCRRSSEAIV